MATSDSSPTKPPENCLGTQRKNIDNEDENDKNAEQSHNANSFYAPGPNTLCCDSADYDNYPGFREPSVSYGYDFAEEMYAAEEAEHKTYLHHQHHHHVNDGGCSMKEACDENSHVGDGGNDEEPESTRTIHVPNPKVGVVVGAVAALRYLHPNFGGKIRIPKDSEVVDMKSAQRIVEITGSIAQIEFAEQLINAVIAEENHEEHMQEETEITSSKKDCEGEQAHM